MYSMLFCMVSYYKLAIVSTTHSIISSPPPTQASEDLLCEEGEVEAAMESRLALASALARQWFGVLLVARTPQDQ